MRRVLLVDKDQKNIDSISALLSKDEHNIQVVGDPDGALHRLIAWKPHLILFDVDILLPTDGADNSTTTSSVIPALLAFVSKARSLSSEEHTALLLLSSSMTVEEVAKALEAGADAYLTRPYQVQDIFAAIVSCLRLKEARDSLKRANHKIDELASSDDLTGLMNMRAAYRRSEDEFVRAKRAGKPISALLLNLDGFSNVNQTFGFLAGSHLLQEVAVCITQCLRTGDFAARVGADEFFVLLPELDLKGATATAEKIRDSIKSIQFKNDKQPVRTTATIGVACLFNDLSKQKMSDLLHFASEALRSAKANGTNRVESYSFT